MNYFKKVSNIIALMILIVFVGCSQKGNYDIKIGAILPLSGEAATYGIDCRRGMEVAEELFEVDIKFEDSQAKTSTAVNAINKLINLNKVNVVIGDMFSNTTLAIKPIAITNDVLLLTPTGASSEIPDAANKIYSIYPSVYDEGAFMAMNLEKEISNIVILKSDEDVFTEMANGFIDKLDNDVNTSVIEFMSNSQNYIDIVTKLRSNNEVKSVYITGYKDDVALLIKQIKETTKKYKIYSQSTLFDENLLSKYNDILNDIVFTAPYYDLENETSLNKQFKELYKEKFNVQPSVWSSYGFDAVKIIKYSIEDDNTIDVVKRINQNADISLLTGPIYFNENGSSVRDFAIYKVENNKFVRVK